MTDVSITMGVEEEYQIIDAQSMRLKPAALDILSDARRSLGAGVQSELKLAQLESVSPICGTLADLRAELRRSRSAVQEAAAREGCCIGAAGTHPFSAWQQQPSTPDDTYSDLMEKYQQLGREQLIFGCHVHIGFDDQELGIQVMNRARNWLSPLLALTASSPYWNGKDTGYASYRTNIWSRWPLSGPPMLFDSHAEYVALTETLLSTASIDAPGRIYWDIRIPEEVDTVEFRLADVCMSLDEAVMLAGLTRALARTCCEQALRDEPYPAVRQEMLRVAHWHAARYGIEESLIDVTAADVVPAPEMIERLLTFVDDALEAEGDREEVRSYVRDVLERGNGAQRQRQAFQKAGNYNDVVGLIVQETLDGVTEE